MNGQTRDMAAEQAQAQELAADRNSIEERLTVLQANQDRINRILGDRRNAFAEAATDMTRASIRAEIEEYSQQLADILSEQTRLRQQVTSLEGRHTALQATVDQHGAQLSTHTTEIQTLQSLTREQAQIGLQHAVSARAHASAIGTLNSGNGWIALVVGLAASFATLVAIEGFYKSEAVMNQKLAWNHELAWIIGIGVLAGLIANVALELLQRREVNQAMATATAQVNVQSAAAVPPPEPEATPTPAASAPVPAAQPQPVVTQAQPVLQPDAVIPPPPPSGQTTYEVQAAAAAAASTN